MKRLLLSILLTLPTICQADWTQSCQQNFVTIAAVGDVLLHQPLQTRAAKVGFEALWSQATTLLREADISYANVEGPIAEGVTRRGWVINDAKPLNPEVYSSYPLFNYPPALASALKSSGIDIVSTANNHSLDRYSIGIDKTIDSLGNAGLPFVGTRKSNSDMGFYQIVKAKGFQLAWIACTQDTNGIRDKNKQVLYCFKRDDRRYILDLIAKLKDHVDGIIVSPHWGKQYSHTPNQAQKHFAKQMLNAGATAIIGSHPHVVQPVVKYKTQDGRDTLIAYSLGNFVSFQGTPKNRSTIILNLALNMSDKNKLELCGLRYRPAYMVNRSGMSRMSLKLLSKKDKNHIAYRILQSVLDDAYFH